MVHLHVEKTIVAPPEKVFAGLADPENLKAAPLIATSVAAFEHEGGTLTFAPDGDGTDVDWVSTYTHPARGGDTVMEALISQLLRWLREGAGALDRLWNKDFQRSRHC